MRCPGCSHQNPGDNRFCESCGVPLGLPASEDNRRSPNLLYAGFLQRFGAWMIDSALVYILGIAVTLPLALLLGLQLGGNAETGTETLVIGQMLGIGVARIASWLYEAGMNSSPNQATLGKLAMRLQVTDLDGAHVSFLTATKRHFASYLSAVVLLAGYLIQPAMRRKQTLHDLLADTLVVQRRPRVAAR